MGMLEIFSDISEFRSHSLKTLPGIYFHHCMWCVVTHAGQFSRSEGTCVSVTKVSLCVCLHPHFIPVL